MEKTTADADLKTRLNVIRTVEGNNQAAIDAVKARNILHEELGYFSDPQTEYGLDDATRNRLIAHTRQDAAHAVLAVGSLAHEVAKVKRLATIIVILLATLTAATIINLFR